MDKPDPTLYWRAGPHPQYPFLNSQLPSMLRLIFFRMIQDWDSQAAQPLMSHPGHWNINATTLGPQQPGRFSDASRALQWKLGAQAFCGQLRGVARSNADDISTAGWMCKMSKPLNYFLGSSLLFLVARCWSCRASLGNEWLDLFGDPHIQSLIQMPGKATNSRWRGCDFVLQLAVQAGATGRSAAIGIFTKGIGTIRNFSRVSAVLMIRNIQVLVALIPQDCNPRVNGFYIWHIWHWHIIKLFHPRRHHDFHGMLPCFSSLIP